MTGTELVNLAKATVPDGLARTLRIRRPLLPRYVGRLELQGLRVAEARVDLVFEREAEHSGRIALTDTQVDGELDVVFDTALPRVPA
jgi:hypothetical protein